MAAVSETIAETEKPNNQINKNMDIEEDGESSKDGQEKDRSSSPANVTPLSGPEIQRNAVKMSSEDCDQLASDVVTVDRPTINDSVSPMSRKACLGNRRRKAVVKDDVKVLPRKTRSQPRLHVVDTADEKFHCDLCNKQFARETDLQVHNTSYDHAQKQRLRDLLMQRERRLGNTSKKTPTNATPNTNDTVDKKIESEDCDKIPSEDITPLAEVNDQATREDSPTSDSSKMEQTAQEGTMVSTPKVEPTLQMIPAPLEAEAQEQTPTDIPVKEAAENKTKNATLDLIPIPDAIPAGSIATETEVSSDPQDATLLKDTTVPEEMVDVDDKLQLDDIPIPSESRSQISVPESSVSAEDIPLPPVEDKQPVQCLDNIPMPMGLSEMETSTITVDSIPMPSASQTGVTLVTSSRDEIPVPPSMSLEEIPVPKALPVDDIPVPSVAVPAPIATDTPGDCPPSKKPSPQLPRLVDSPKSGLVCFSFARKAALKQAAASVFAVEEPTQMPASLARVGIVDAGYGDDDEIKEAEEQVGFVSVVSLDDTTRLHWPSEMVQRTVTGEKSVNYSCNPLCFDFSQLSRNPRATAFTITNETSAPKKRSKKKSKKAKKDNSNATGDKKRRKSHDAKHNGQDENMAKDGNEKGKKRKKKRKKTQKVTQEGEGGESSANEEEEEGKKMRRKYRKRRKAESDNEHNDGLKGSGEFQLKKAKTGCALTPTIGKPVNTKVIAITKVSLAPATEKMIPEKTHAEKKVSENKPVEKKVSERKDSEKSASSKRDSDTKLSEKTTVEVKRTFDPEDMEMKGTKDTGRSKWDTSSESEIETEVKRTAVPSSTPPVAKANDNTGKDEKSKETSPHHHRDGSRRSRSSRSRSSRSSSSRDSRGRHHRSASYSTDDSTYERRHRHHRRHHSSSSESRSRSRSGSRHGRRRRSYSRSRSSESRSSRSHSGGFRASKSSPKRARKAKVTKNAAAKSVPSKPVTSNKTETVVKEAATPVTAAKEDAEVPVADSIPLPPTSSVSTAPLNIPLPSQPPEGCPIEHTFRPIGPNDPLVFKVPLPPSDPSKADESAPPPPPPPNGPEPPTTFCIPPEQAEQYKALAEQAQIHAASRMRRQQRRLAGLDSESSEEEEDSEQLIDVEQMQQLQQQMLQVQQQQMLQAQQQQQPMVMQRVPMMLQPQLIPQAATAQPHLVPMSMGTTLMSGASPFGLVHTASVAQPSLQLIPQAGAPVMVAPQPSPIMHVIGPGGVPMAVRQVPAAQPQLPMFAGGLMHHPMSALQPTLPGILPNGMLTQGMVPHAAYSGLTPQPMMGGLQPQIMLMPRIMRIPHM